MNPRFIILMVIAVAIAGFTAFGVRSKLSGSVTSGPMVLVAAEAIPAGSFVRSEKHLTWMEWPSKNISSNYIIQGGKVKPEEFNGAVARRSIAAGDPISGNVLVKSNEGGFLSAVLNPGKRAVSIAVNAITGNAGFIFPGDNVDLIVTHNIPAKDESGGSQKALASETFVENVRVLAIDQMLDNPDNKAVLAKTVTLEVTPKQAEMIHVANGIGKISLTLRSLSTNGDAVVTDETTFTRDSDISKLLNKRSNVNSRVQVIRGGETQELEFNQVGQ